MKKIWVVVLVVLLVAVLSSAVTAYIIHDRNVKESIRLAEEAKRKEAERIEQERKIRLERERREAEAVKMRKLEMAVKRADKNRAAVEKQVAEDREYMDRLHEIAKFSTLSAPAQDEVKFLVKILSSRYGDLGITINPTWVRLEGMDEAEKRFSERAKQIRIAAVKKQLEALKVLSDYQMKKAIDGE